jgi:MoaA/NifB/PqqE/SkfB family radical SAM enzyme
MGSGLTETRSRDTRPSLLSALRAQRDAHARILASSPRRPTFRKKNRSAFTNFLRAKYEAYTGAVDVTSYPYYLCVDPADVCQLRCPTCPTGIENERRKGPAELRFVYRRTRSILPPSLFDSLLDEMGDYLFLIMFYNYGEPLLNRSLPDFIRKARARDIETEVHTNLSLPLSQQQIDDLMSSGLDYLNASIDGFSQETYQVHRVGGDLGLVKQNLERLVEARSRLGASTEITYKYLVFKHNEHEVFAARDYCQQLGIRFVFGDAFITDAAWLPSHRQHELPYYSQADVQRRQLEWEAAGKGSYWGEHELTPNWIPGKATEMHAPPFCGWHYGVSVVTAGGPVAPCCAAAKEVDDFGTLVPGSVRFADVWNNDRVRRSRAAFANKELPEAAHADSVCLRCYFPKFVQQIYAIHDAKVAAQFYKEYGGRDSQLERAFDLLTQRRYAPAPRALIRRGVIHEAAIAKGNEGHENDTGEFVDYFEQRLIHELPAVRSGVAARSRTPALPLRLVLGDGTAWASLRRGWYPGESSPGGPLRWSKGRRSALAVPLPAGGDVSMVLDCQPLAVPDCGPQRITVALNGEPVHDVVMSPGRGRYVVRLPAAVVRDGSLNRLEFRYAYARRPKSVLPDTTDTRVLAVAWYSIEFARPAADAPG